MQNNMEELFSLLIDKKGNPFDKDIVNNWYVARNFILGHTKFQNLSIGPNSSEHLHVIVNGDSPLMLAVVRQVALIAHFPNFVEEDKEDKGECKNQTVITIVRHENKTDEDLLSKLSEEHVLNHLILNSLTSYRMEEYPKLPLDIKIEIESEMPKVIDSEDKICIVINESEVEKFINSRKEPNLINTSMARMLNMVYMTGADIDNLPSDDPDTVSQYNTALDYFCYQTKEEKMNKNWNDSANPEKRKVGYIDIRNKLSNIFCSDCFEMRLRGIIDTSKHSLEYYLRYKPKSVQKALKENILPLAKCEHARWNVEKLIMGFRPLTLKEHYHEEELFGDERKEYRNKLKKGKYYKGKKNDPAHIDLCSYNDLKRLHPENIKYDYFLTLAIPHILRETIYSYKR